MTQWQASAPSNIALIKYMGKIDVLKNVPSNASLSYTLNHLRTTVILTEIDAKEDQWDKRCQFNLQEKQRFLNHLAFLKKHFSCQKNFCIYSENNFPVGCGLASSASSFAALTLCATRAFGLTLSAETLAALSRQGSGSSCRSFFSPWSLWDAEEVRAPDLPYCELIHQVVVVSRDKKAVSSSEAHQHVQTSPLFTRRASRAEYRLKLLLKSLYAQDWEKSYKIVRQEFWDMHALFETCTAPFQYLLPSTINVLKMIDTIWKTEKDGPLVTMDAGPNVHLLYRLDQQKLAETMQMKFKALNLLVL